MEKFFSVNPKPALICLSCLRSKGWVDERDFDIAQERKFKQEEQDTCLWCNKVQHKVPLGWDT